MQCSPTFVLAAPMESPSTDILLHLWLTRIWLDQLPTLLGRSFSCILLVLLVAFPFNMGQSRFQCPISPQMKQDVSCCFGYPWSTICIYALFAFDPRQCCLLPIIPFWSPLLGHPSQHVPKTKNPNYLEMS
jgi:hypothetical protein